MFALRVTGGSGKGGAVWVQTNASGVVISVNGIVAAGTGYSATTGAATTFNYEVTASMGLATSVAIVGTSGNANVDVTLTSPADNTIAQAIVDVKGYPMVEFLFANTNTTDANCLICGL